MEIRNKTAETQYVTVVCKTTGAMDTVCLHPNEKTVLDDRWKPTLEASYSKSIEIKG